jgi:hypothetical protein
MKKVNLTFKTIRSHVVLQPDWKKILEGNTMIHSTDL